MIPFFENPKQPFRIHLVRKINFLLHHHTQLELFYVKEGSTYVTVNENTQKLSRGDIAIIFPDQLHSYESNDLNSICLVALCDVSYTGSFSNILYKYYPDSPFVSSEIVHKNVSFAFDELYNEFKGPQNDKVYKALVELIFARVMPHFTLRQTQDLVIYNLTYQVSQYITDHFQEEITMERLSKALCVSKYYLSHIFSEKMKTSFSNYLNSIRLEYALDKIRNTDKSITEIWVDAGFNSQRTFYRSFKNTYHISPMQYRYQIKEFAKNTTI